MVASGEGPRLKALLKATRIPQAEFARAAGVVKQSVTKWFTRDAFGDPTWAKVRDALVKLGLRPDQVRTPTAGGDRQALYITIRDWPIEQLEVVHRILLADPIEHDALLAFVTGVLRDRIR